MLYIPPASVRRFVTFLKALCNSLAVVVAQGARGQLLKPQQNTATSPCLSNLTEQTAAEQIAVLMGACCCSDSASDPDIERTSLLDSNNKPVFFDPRSPDPQVRRTPYLSSKRQKNNGSGQLRGSGTGGSSAFQPVNQTPAHTDDSNDMYGRSV